MKYDDISESVPGAVGDIYVGGVKWGRFFKRSDGSWAKDQRKDEDPTHKFVVHKTAAVGISTEGIKATCERCGLALGTIILDHLKSCPADHRELGLPGNWSCSWNLVPLCEGERRKVEAFEWPERT